MRLNDGLIVVWMNVANRFDEELHAWYETEHVPEIASLPGINSVRRCIDPAHPLRYMAMFECVNENVENGPAFKHMIDNATPWTRRIRTLFGEQRRRGNYRKIQDRCSTETGAMATAAWLVVQKNTDPQEAGPTADALTDCIRYRAFVQAPPVEVFRPELTYMQIYDFASVEAADAARQRFALTMDASISLRHPVGVPAMVSDSEFSRRQEIWDATEIARRMAKGFTVPFAATTEPAVQFTMPEKKVAA